MPVIYCNKLCPGKNGRKCKWSTEIQRRPARIRDDADFCQVCLACDKGEWEFAKLSLQLSHLYSMDPDIFHSARRQMPLSVFDGVSALVMATLVSTVPHQKNAREMKRRTFLINTLGHLTEASWILDCWRRKVLEDARNVQNMELAMPSVLAGTTKGLIVEFMCGSLDVLYSYICQVKANSYHTLEKPIFWHPTRDWVVPCEKASARTMLIGVYKHILEYYHKPKIRRLKQVIVLHDHFMKNYQPLVSRSRGCRRLHHILERMLEKQVEIISSPPF